MGGQMRYLAAAGIVIVAILSAQPVIAWTFVTGPTVSIDGKTGDLVVSWTETGLGNTPITYDFGVYLAFSSTGCFTRSGNAPPGQNNLPSAEASQWSTSATITPSNGQITSTLDLAPPPLAVQGCRGQGLMACLTSVKYDSPMFEDETGEIVGLGSENETSETVIEIPNDVFSASANGLSPPFFPNSCVSPPT
jgi:hypothetical protein